MYTNSKKISGDAMNWNVQYQKENYWEELKNEYIISKDDLSLLQNNIYNNMKKYVKYSMDIFLTPLQKECYIRYYSMTESNKVKIIAKDMGISEHSVYKHIEKANGKLYVLGELFLKSCGYKSYYDDIKNKLIAVIEYLPDIQYKIIKLYYLDLKNSKYICNYLNLSKQDFNTHLNEALKILKKNNLSSTCLSDFRKKLKDKNRLISTKAWGS